MPSSLPKLPEILNHDELVRLFTVTTNPNHMTAYVRIAALRADEGSEGRTAMQAELAELQDRQWLGVVKDDVIEEIGRLRARQALEDVFDATVTNRITTKSREIAEQLVMNTLRAQFSLEVEELGVAGLAIELRRSLSPVVALVTARTTFS